MAFQPATRTALAKRLFEVMDTVRNKPVSAKFSAAESFLDEVYLVIQKGAPARAKPAMIDNSAPQITYQFAFSDSASSYSYEVKDGAKSLSKGGGNLKAENPSHCAILAAIGVIEKVVTEFGHSRKMQMRTDSTFIHNGISGWVKGWRSNGWLTAKKQPVAHKEEWEKLADLVAGSKIEILLAA